MASIGNCIKLSAIAATSAEWSVNECQERGWVLSAGANFAQSGTCPV
jgi:hypothetical protein